MKCIKHERDKEISKVLRMTFHYGMETYDHDGTFSLKGPMVCIIFNFNFDFSGLLKIILSLVD